MRYTFRPDDCMIITIPLGSLRDAREGQLMPEKFTCRFKDTYKVFQRGRPKALGVSQIITAVFLLCVGGILISKNHNEPAPLYIVPPILYIVCGTLAIAAGHTPLMPMMKTSFVFNIISLCLAVIICSLVLIIKPPFHHRYQDNNLHIGLAVGNIVLHVFECVLSALLIFLESKAVCRAHFNSLPMITLKQDM